MPSERATGDEVAALYAEHPYPDHGVVSTVVARMARAALSGRVPRRILDAGCGTGEQTLGLAKEFPGAEVVGIDANPASIERAREHARRHCIAARFEVADVLAPLDSFGPFGLVVIIGVLHHLADPGAALRNLRAVAEPEATLLGMVYGTFGKSETFLQRDALQIVAGDERADRLEALRSLRWRLNNGVVHYVELLRRRLRFGPDIAPAEALRRVLRGRSTAYQADSFTHVHELTYTWAELGALLRETGWDLSGWPRRSGMPDHPSDLFRDRVARSLAKRPPLEQAAVYERLVRPSNLYFVARFPTVHGQSQVSR